jgi:hypothetical protein
MVEKIKIDKLKVRETIKAEFFDVIGTKVLRDFLLAIHSHLY